MLYQQVVLSPSIKPQPGVFPPGFPPVKSPQPSTSLPFSALRLSLHQLRAQERRALQGAPHGWSSLTSGETLGGLKTHHR